MENSVTNHTILKYLLTTKNKIEEYNNIVVSVSGGSDSDIMLDMFNRYDEEKKVKYVFFDTGLEYQATKEHLTYLENKYNIAIHREKAIKSIPVSCKEYGQPFISKNVYEMIDRLQRHKFNWSDKPFDVLYDEYPKCKSALMWWCNNHPDGSQFNISQNKYFKEFMVANPPTFKISSKCCAYAKKDLAKRFNRNNKTDLDVTGVRRSEGGVRATAYKNCFDSADKTDYAKYRPLFFWNNTDKAEYKKLFDVKYSDCYEVYEMTRTGCAGCPYSRKIEEELRVIEDYEPKLLKAVNSVFKDNYEYTRKYKDFRARIELSK